MTPLITLFLRLPLTKRNGFVLFMENIRRIFIHLFGFEERFHLHAM